MKVTRTSIMQWDKELQDYVTVYEDSYEYDGPVAEMKGGGSNSTTTVQEAEPPKFIQPFLTDAANQASQINKNFVPQLYNGPTVAGISPYADAAVQGLGAVNNSTFNQGVLNAGQNTISTLNALSNPGANPLLQASSGAANQGADFLQSFLQNGQQPSQFSQTAADIAQGGTANPFLDDVVQRTLGAITRNTQESILPSIGDSAINAGQYGGSRQGVAEGLVLSRLNDTLADTAANLYGNEFNRKEAARLNAASVGGQLDATNIAQLLQGTNLGFQGLEGGTSQVLDAATRQGSLLPSLQQTQNFGFDNLLRAGAVDQDYRQRLLDDEISRFNFTQSLPTNMQNDFINQLAALAGFGGTTTSTATGPDNSPSTFSKVLGGAAAGSAILPGWGTALGALGGLIL